MEKELFASSEAPRLWNVSPEPKDSPWGPVQHAEQVAPGIWSVGTAGHGGIMLSIERNAAMPECLRRKNGCYEEDCEWALVALFYKDEFDTLRPWQIKQGVTETHYVGAIKSAKDWHPDEYQRFTGETLSVEESFILRVRKFDDDNADNLVVLAAWGDWAQFVPTGMVGIVARQGGRSKHATGPERWFLVPKDEYEGRSAHFVVDPSRHQEITEPPQNARA